MKLRLEDQGDGWFWSRPAIEAEVVEQAWYHSRRYYKVRLHPPLEQQKALREGLLDHLARQVREGRLGQEDGSSA